MQLVYVTEFRDVEEAIAFEKKVKGWSRKKKEALIAGRFEYLPFLSMNAEKRERLRQAQPDIEEE